jgi:hypothetical protein
VSILTVTAPASDLNLLTLPEIRAAVRVATGQDADLETLRKQVAASITRACKIASAGATPPTLRKETLSETFRLKSRQDSLVLARRPIVSVSSVTEDGTAVDADDYELDAAAGLLYRLSGDVRTCWPCGKIVVAYAAGWETVPEDLKLAASKLAAVLWSEGERVDPNLKRDRVDGVGEKEYWVSPSDDPLIPSEVMDLLTPYLNHWVG